MPTKQISDLHRKKKTAASFSVISNSILVILKLTVGLISGAVSIIAEAIHSGIDLLAAIIARYSIVKSAEPADEKHHFGHGKVESVSALLEGLLIFFAAYLIIHEACDKIIHGVKIEIIGVGIGIMLVSTVANILISRYLFKIAKETKSDALNADAWHLKTDVYTSLGVFTALLLIRFLQGIIPHVEYLDPAIALATAIWISFAAFQITKDAILNLVDTKISEEEETVIKKAILENSGTFIDFHKLRSRRSGPYTYLDLHLVVSRDLSVDNAHKLTHHIEQDIKKSLRNTDIMFHLEPCNSRCKTCKMKCTKQ
ncbi:MAG: cation diffusion facilitator family transporter [Candidatus Firestonebacteria bacterium]